jgi:hypothetical protein
MQQKVSLLFMRSVAAILLLTAAAKLTTSVGSSRALLLPDPILVLPFHHVFWIAGVLELLVALVCILAKEARVKACAVAWLATCLVIYRVGLLWIGYRMPCSCLGNLTDSLHVSPRGADMIMKVVLAYLLAGSYAALLMQRRRERVAQLMPPTCVASA